MLALTASLNFQPLSPAGQCMGCSLSSTATSTIAMSSDAASSTAASGPPPLRVLLITHNVCGIFDDTSGAARAMWVAEIAALAAEHDADFVALHMQETGGSDWRTNALEGVAPLAAALAAACPEYWSSGVLCNTDTSDESRFTALSCCFLVRRRALPRVRLWHFGDGGRAAGFVTLEHEAAPALAAAALPAQLCRHQRFPQDFFPEFPTWSRKGHLHTRWQLGDVSARAIRRNSPRARLSLRPPPTARPALLPAGVVRPGQLPQLPRPGQLRLPAARRGGRRRDAVGVRARAEPRPRAHRALGGGGGDR